MLHLKRIFISIELSSPKIVDEEILSLICYFFLNLKEILKSIWFHDKKIKKNLKFLFCSTFKLSFINIIIINMNNDFKNNEGNIAGHNADYARTTIKNILYKKIAFLIKW